MEGDAAYFARRAHQEHIAGKEARHPEQRRAHLEIAARYLDLAREIRLQERLLLAADRNQRQTAKLHRHAASTGVSL